MTALEYLKAKNKLVERVTGHILIPEDQLVEHEPNMAQFRPLPRLTTSNCTYCTLYYYDYCEGCPMKEAGNRCIDHPKSSYRKATNAWDKKATEEDMTELRRLGKRFQKEYEE